MANLVGSEPMFGVLDVVEVAQVEPLIGLGLSGRRAAVLQVRRQSDGAYRYSLGTVPDAGDDEVAGIYDEPQLVATGRRVEAEPYGPPAPFRLRDVVTIGDDCDIEEARGREGYVDSAYESDYVILDDIEHHL